MTTLYALIHLMAFLRDRWGRLLLAERVLMAMLALLGTVMVVVMFWAENLFSVVVCVLWAIALYIAVVVSSINAAHRLAQQNLTEKYLEQYGGEHVLADREGERYHFVIGGNGWEYVPPQPE